MDHYIDIRVKPDPEFGQTELLNALFAKLHRVLPSVTEGRVGISFPLYGKSLGSCLRLHGSLPDLQHLLANNWRQGLRDYTQVQGPEVVPPTARYRTVRRIQSKSAHNKRQRSIAKGWLTEQQALQSIPDSQQKVIKLPYVELLSLSTRSRMRVYIEHGPLTDTPVYGQFNAYGLSATATIPWF